TAEIESALVAHPKVAEAAVVGCPHEVKGQGIYVYVTLIAGVEPNEALRAELREWVRRDIGAIATPDFIQWAPSLPKTRSGKIMRRILRKIAANEHDQLGDTSTLADPAVVDDLVGNRMNRPKRSKTPPSGADWPALGISEAGQHAAAVRSDLEDAVTSLGVRFGVAFLEQEGFGADGDLHLARVETERRAVPVAQILLVRRQLAAVPEAAEDRHAVVVEGDHDPPVHRRRGVGPRHQGL